MKQYKVEVLTFSPKLTFKTDDIANRAMEGIQAKLDEYARKGYTLHHSTSMEYGGDLRFYLYFEKDV
jgi:hypothetical protein